jgi:murein L,D-transpeptidase YafK
MMVLRFSRDVGRAHASRARPWSAALSALLLLASIAAEAQQATPDARPNDDRVATSAFFSGSPLLIRIFKEESQLELWMQSGDRFQLLATYPICFWSGALGPKLYEGDRQAPEGFYSIGLSQLVVTGKHARSFDIGFPNAFDRSLGRTGSHILLHGGCRSIGCFAMTDPVMDRIYDLAQQALRAGQTAIPVHVFPFRMTDTNLQRHASSPWRAFWANLKQGHDAFEATRQSPVLQTCRGTYRVKDESDGPQGAPSADCSVQTPAIAQTKNPSGVPIYATIPGSAAGRMSLSARRLSSSMRTATTPIALPRDNVAECNRLWSRSTGITQENWRGICKKLDFQPKRVQRTAHRAS